MRGEDLGLTEYTALRKDGSTFPSLFHSTPIIRQGKPVGLRGFIIDITERKRMEDELRKSEEKFSKAFRSSPDWVCISTLDEGRYLDVNDAYCRGTGWSMEEVMGHTSTEIGLWDNTHDRIEAVEILSKEGRLRNKEVTFRHKNGMKIAALWSADMIQLGSENCLISIVTDITERKRAEEKVEESEARYRSVFENAGTATVIMEEDRVISMANPEFEKLSGYSREEVEGQMTWTEFVVPEDLERMRQYHRERREKGEKAPTEYEFRFIDREGDIKHIYNKVAVIPGTGKSVASLTDMTTRKRAEMELVRLNTAIEQAAETIVITDIEGTIQYVNPAFERITGYTKEEALGENPRILKSGKHDKGFYKALWDTITRGKIWSGRFTNRKKDGTLYEEEATISPVLDSSGEPINYVAVKRDVTNELRMEKQFRQAQKMEAIGTLAGGIAHDFNNILGSVIGYTELADLDLPDGVKAKYNLKAVLKACDRAKDLVNQILAFSRQSEEKRRPIQIAPIVKEALKLLRATLPANIEIRRQVKEDMAIVEADSTKIHQVLMNLCTNAAHAMQGKSGVLEVSLKNVQLDADVVLRHKGLAPGPYLLLTVSDTGHGMTPDMVERIFDPYFTTKDKGVGTGMGLAVVHGIVRGYGGAIEVQSEIGEGSTFHVYLPVVEREATKEPEILESLPAGNENILFIDDEPGLVDIGRQMLQRLGYEVVTRTSSIEALELFRTKPDSFDLVITDMTMPQMTGDKLAGEFIKLRPNIPIILCTGYSAYISEEKAKNMGIRAFAMKPLVLRDLAKTVRKVLDEK
ncbi:MAG: PAS domain S-box protein [Deltaproteobacteria bacterium]|nr:PAS domain S-box protein [Deltaproteobacteria bacterium]